VRRLIFVGGVSGSGKSTFCERVKGPWAPKNAGALIAHELRGGPQRRYLRPLVAGAAEAERFQHVLLAGLHRLQDRRVVLDGHYVVPTVQGQVPVPGWVFHELRPELLFLVEATPGVVARRLRERTSPSWWDGQEDSIQRAADAERRCAQLISSEMGRRLIVIDGNSLAASWTPDSFLRAETPGSC
jgi:adenylate kinase